MVKIGSAQNLVVNTNFFSDAVTFVASKPNLYICCTRRGTEVQHLATA